MQNPRLAGRYAKSLIDLAIERNQLDAAHADMQYLQAACKSSKDFVALLRSPIIKADKKDKILQAVTAGKVSDLTAGFNKLLVNKSREQFLPEIITAFIEQYNAIKGIQRVKLTTATSISDELKQSIISKIKAATGFEHLEVETATQPDLIGGFVLEFNNKLVDASILRDLRDIKTQFQKNIYVRNIR
ncbi:MAG: synthase subunit delta [Bacteroidota bacterium]